MSATPRPAPREPAAARVAPRAGLGAALRAWREQHLHALVSSAGRAAARPLSTLLTVGVMAIAIALPLGLLLAMANLERFSGSVREAREVSVYLRHEVDMPRAATLADEVAAWPEVAGVVVRSPDEGLEEFRRMSELAGALDLLEGNPLPAVLVVAPAGEAGGDAASLAAGAALVERLGALAEVEQVQDDAAWRARLGAWLDFGERLGSVVAALLGLGVLLVVGNTIRLELHARADEIAVLQLLGATDGFVRRPFLYLGAWYGAAAGGLALALLWLGAAALQGPLSRLVASYGGDVALAGFGPAGNAAVLAAAVALGWLGAWLATGHHLRRTRPTEV